MRRSPQTHFSCARTPLGRVTLALLCAGWLSLLLAQSPPRGRMGQPAGHDTVVGIPAGVSWQVQLLGPVDTRVKADVYIVDLVDVTASKVRAIREGARPPRRVVCYISAGTYENWRPDVLRYPAKVKGKPNGWPGEQWVDIRQWSILGPILEARLDLCRVKGFDAVDFDNVDGWTHDTGFPLTAADQLRFNRHLANAAHQRGLAVGLKNDLQQVEDLEPFFDFAINESCDRYKECERLLPFIKAGKAVLHVEYAGHPATFCPRTRALGLSTIRKTVELNSWVVSCPGE